MDKVINLKCRVNSSGYLKQLIPVVPESETLSYKLVTPENIYSDYDDEVGFCLNFAGGPRFYKGAIIEDYKVKDVTYVAGIGYVITFENDTVSNE